MQCSYTLAISYTIIVIATYLPSDNILWVEVICGVTFICEAGGCMKSWKSTLTHVTSLAMYTVALEVALCDMYYVTSVMYYAVCDN